MKSFDATDMLNPVVIKEVRQGLKSKRFLGVFLLLVLAMTSGISISLLPETVSKMREMSTATFWTVASICFLGMLPLLGINAITSEKKEKTFELVMLTRVSSWRLVYGKWQSLAVKTLLVATTLLPYMVLRHYIGGIELAMEVVFLAMMLIVSVLLSAFVVFVSTFENWLIRLGLIGLQLWAVGGSIALAIPSVGGHAGPPSLAEGLGTIAISLAFVVMLIVLVLEMAASRLAPISENHAIRKRGLALLGLVIAMLGMFTDVGEPFSFFACVMLYFVAFDACTERFAPTPTLYLPFVKRGFLGRATGFVFYPGPASATFFVVLCTVLIPAVFVIVQNFEIARGVQLAVTIGSTLLVPLAIARLFAKRIKRPGLVFLGFHATMALVAAVGQAAVEVLSMGSTSTRIPYVVPSTALITALFDNVNDDHAFASIALNGALMAIAFFYLMVGRAADWRAVAEQERRAAALLERNGG